MLILISGSSSTQCDGGVEDIIIPQAKKPQLSPHSSTDEGDKY